MRGYWGALFVFMGLILGCSDASSDGSTGQEQTASCDQGCQDRAMAIGINSTIWMFYNQEVAGRSAGTVTKNDIACPLGGTASLTGSASTASNGITTVTLTYDLAACGNSGNTFSVVLTGKFHQQGTFGNGSTTVTTSSVDAVTIAGTAKTPDRPAIQETCLATVTDQRSGSSSTLKGTICGREFFVSD